MPNHLDLPRPEADEIIALRKTAPISAWKPLYVGRNEMWLMATGVISEKGLYKRALTIELICKRSQKPFRDMFKFCLFKAEHGAPRRAYQLDTTNVPICGPEEHGWPHEHIGIDRKLFPANGFPATFEDSLEHFCQAVNMAFEESIESPFEFTLRP
jgi:hypothetical protein